jgi:hypothetical protein
MTGYLGEKSYPLSTRLLIHAWLVLRIPILRRNLILSHADCAVGRDLVGSSSYAFRPLLLVPGALQSGWIAERASAIVQAAIAHLA